MFKNLGCFGKSQRVSFDHIKWDVLDELHRPDLMVDEQKSAISGRKRTDHLQLSSVAINAALTSLVEEPRFSNDMVSRHC